MWGRTWLKHYARLLQTSYCNISHTALKLSELGSEDIRHPFHFPEQIGDLRPIFSAQQPSLRRIHHISGYLQMSYCYKFVNTNLILLMVDLVFEGQVNGLGP